MFGTFGSTLTTLRESAFFRWFSLQPDAAENETGTLTFRPSGPAFHDLVTFEAATGENQTLRELRLTLARSFVDDPRNGAFALDITKSFLRDALGEIPLVRDLERRLAQGVDIRRADSIVPAPVGLSAAEERVLQTYAGSVQQSELDVSGSRVKFDNEAHPGMLTIAIQAQTA